MYIYRTDDATALTAEELMNQGELYTKDSAEWENFTFNGTERVRLSFSENLWSYEIDKHIYVMFYITYDGNTYYGSVKDRQERAILESIRDTGKAGNTTFSTKEELDLVNAILGMFTAAKAYRASIGLD